MRDVVKSYFQPAFLICTIMLAVAAGTMPLMIKAFGVIMKKEPLPIKKSLDLLDEKGLGVYKVIRKEKIDNQEIVKSLGTEDYIEWLLEDTEEKSESDVKFCSLFITYYSLPDRVPHVPEECYSGGGHQQLSSDSVNFYIPIGSWQGKEKVGNEKLEIPGRYLVFSKKSSNDWLMGEQKFSVLYLFNVNGSYESSRGGARRALNLNLGKHAFFSKVEWSFVAGNGLRTHPAKEKAIKASEKLLGVILPVLENEHWPIITDTNSNKADK